MAKSPSTLPPSGKVVSGSDCDGARGPSSSSINRQPDTSTSPSATKENAAAGKSVEPATISPTLTICRNKHWRFISSFHGPWLQLPLEVLEMIANINYNTSRPRHVDPGVGFDMLKVRSGVDEATTLAVRAANELVSSTLTNVGGSGGHLSGALSSGHGPKMSRERKLRMRELACKRLARAYRSDEIACSVATMQGASALEHIGANVLLQNSDDLDAKYVHFFHEKIPSRKVVECTDLAPLSDIIARSYGQAEALRTRATVKVFRDDLDGAVQDLTEALRLARSRGLAHSSNDQPSPSQQQLVRDGNGKRPQAATLAEEDQPTGLVSQLLFHRASAYLTQACRHIEKALPLDAVDTSEPAPETVESRKLVKTLAKRALKDYMDFLSSFDYSANVHHKTIQDFHERIVEATRKIRRPRSYQPTSQQPTVYALHDLFTAVPPADLPPYPPPEDAGSSSLPRGAGPYLEVVTYHPLLSEALHSMLLCHCLVQTSAKELLRHANMVARLVSLTDGHPFFLASRSPARSDWVDIVRRTKNWLRLSASWEDLCEPVLIQKFFEQEATLGPAAAKIVDGAIARKRIAMPESSSSSPGSETPDIGKLDIAKPASSASQSAPADDLREYPFLTEKAPIIARWVREAPLVTGTSAKRKKRAKKPASKSG